MILLDTNILVRLANRNDVDYQTTHTAITGCRRSGRKLLVAQQSLHEFWVAATRPPQKNGMGMTPARADKYLGRFLRLFGLAIDPPQLFDEWRALVNTRAIAGLRAYDARLAAIVTALRLRGLMTYNVADFKDLPITLVSPRDPSTW